MTGFKAPSGEWLGEEVEKQKRRDAEESGEAVIVIEETPEFVLPIGLVEPVESESPVMSPGTPEAHREFGLEEARKAFFGALSLADLGREWLDSIGYRDATRGKAEGAAAALAHVIELIEVREGGRSADEKS